MTQPWIWWATTVEEARELRRLQARRQVRPWPYLGPCNCPSRYPRCSERSVDRCPCEHTPECHDRQRKICRRCLGQRHIVKCCPYPGGTFPPFDAFAVYQAVVAKLAGTP